MADKRGITLIETMVAITILTFALGGPFVLANQSLQAAGYSREEVLASRLAEESLEMVHSLRDNNSIDGNSWSAGAGAWATLMSNCVSKACAVAMHQQQAGGSGGALTIWNNNSVISCGGSATCSGQFASDVYLNSTTGVYAQFASSPGAGWVKQPYTREIILAPLTISNAQAVAQVAEYTVTATVTYRAGKITKTIKVNDTIRDWFPKLNGGVIQ